MGSRAGRGIDDGLSGLKSKKCSTDFISKLACSASQLATDTIFHTNADGLCSALVQSSMLGGKAGPFPSNSFEGSGSLPVYSGEPRRGQRALLRSVGYRSGAMRETGCQEYDEFSKGAQR
jgi:hypothetical protein